MKQGTITGISGPVIDVRFPEGTLPAINEALTVQVGGITYTMEVEQHLENKTVRCVMMAGSDGLSRGLTVTATGHGIAIPVGEATLGRMFNVLGDPIDGGAPVPVPGRPLPEEYRTENVGFVEAGCCNLLHHINTVKRSGVSPVVCINAFVTDTKAEIAKVRELCEAAGARVALSTHWEHGGEGALELAQAVVEACEEPVNIKFLYDLDMPLRQRVELIAKEVYGADGVDWAPLAVQKAERFESDPKYKDYCTMMVKTHLSLSDDPTKKGVPTGWRLAIRDILEYGGAKFLCPMAGTISMMPGTAANPAYRRIDVDTETGKVSGLF